MCGPQLDLSLPFVSMLNNDSVRLCMHNHLLQRHVQIFGGMHVSTAGEGHGL